MPRSSATLSKASKSSHAPSFPCQEPDTETTLEKLSKYIHDSDVVLCLQGTYTGGFPPVSALDRPIHPVARTDRDEETWRDLLPTGFENISYTQWEFVLSRYWEKPAFIFIASGHQPDSSKPEPEIDDLRQQQDFLNYLTSYFGFDRNPFDNRDKLCRDALCCLWPEHESDDKLTEILARYDAKLDDIFRSQIKVEGIFSEIIDHFTRASVPHKFTPLSGPEAMTRKRPHVDVVGREHDIRSVCDQLKPGRTFFLTGPPGVGKSAVAYEAVRRCVPDSPKRGDTFPEGVIFLDFYSSSKPESRLIEKWSDIAFYFTGQRPKKGAESDEAASACRGRKALFVIEGGERLQSRSEIDDLLSVMCGGSAALIMTRNTAHGGPNDNLEVGELHPKDSLHLLESWTAKVTIADRLQVLTDVVEIAGHYPHLLTMAGRYLRQRPKRAKRYIEDLRADPLEHFHDPDNPEHNANRFYRRTLEALPLLSRQVIMLAGALAENQWPAAAIRQAFGGQANELKVMHALSQLEDFGLVIADDSDTESYTCAHALIYVFASKQSMSPDLTDLKQRLEDWAKQELNRARSTDCTAAIALVLPHIFCLFKDKQVSAEVADSLVSTAEKLGTLSESAAVDKEWEQAENWLTKCEEIIDRLAVKQADPEWVRKSFTIFDRLGEIAMSQEELGKAVGLFKAFKDFVGKLVAQYPGNLKFQRDLYAAQIRLGMIMWAQGDLAAADLNFNECYAIAKEAHEIDPSSAEDQFNLCVSLVRLGEMAVAKGLLAEAIRFFTDEGKRWQDFKKVYPDYDGWERAPVRRLRKLDSPAMAKCDISGALDHYKKAHEILKRLKDEDLASKEWLQKQSVLLEELGTVTQTGEHWHGALICLTLCMMIETVFPSSDPLRIGRIAEKRKLLIGKNGDLIHKLKAKDTTGRWAYYFVLVFTPEEKGFMEAIDGDGTIDLEDFGELVASCYGEEPDQVVRDYLEKEYGFDLESPTHASGQRDLYVEQTKLGELAVAQGDLERALRSFTEAKVIAERHAAIDTANAAWQRDLFDCCQAIAGKVFQPQQRWGEALELAEQCLAISDRMAASDPTSIDWQKDVAASRAMVAELQGKV